LRRATALLAAAFAGASLLAAVPPPGPVVSPLQTLVDAAPTGSTITVASGTYGGDLVIDHSIRLVGRGRPLLRGS
jgi:nitrous oxidase accessory protein NosD